MICSLKKSKQKGLFYAYHLLCLSIMLYSLSMVCLVHKSYYQFYDSWNFPNIFEDSLMRSPMKMLFGGTGLKSIFNFLIIPAFFAIIIICKKKRFYPAHCITFFYTLFSYLLMDDFREGYAYYWYAAGGGGRTIILTHMDLVSYSSQIITSIAFQTYVFSSFRAHHQFD